MDRGGTITWYLNANDTDFMATLTKARAEARAAGGDIDRSLNKGAQNAGKSVKQLGNDTNTLSGSLKTVRRDVVGLGGDTNILGGNFAGASSTSNALSNALGGTALRSQGLRNSLASLSNESRSLGSALGGTALRNFNTNVGQTSGSTKRATKDIEGFRLSLKDFHSDLGQAATRFRNFQIALRGFELTGLIVMALTAAGALIELGGAVVALTGLLATVPAFAGAAAGALATIKIATSGIGDAFKQLVKPVKGATAAQSLQKRQSDLVATAMRRDADLVRRMADLNEQYSDTVKELAEERLRVLNETILEGVEAWEEMSRAANNFLDISDGLKDQQLLVEEAQAELNLALVEYGMNSQQAAEASRKLFAAQGDLAQSTADMDEQYGSVKDNIKDLATNLNSLQKANRNQMSATLSNLKALKLDKQIRGEDTAEVSKMIGVLEELIDIKDTRLTTNVDTATAQKELDTLKNMYPDIAVAAQQSSTATEQSLTKSLRNISDSMADVRRERAELQADLSSNLAEAAEQSAIGAQGTDPFAGLSKNARSFVIALKEVYDAFQPIKMTIQDKFFAGLDQEIKDVATKSFPILQVGLGNIATAMNGFLKETSNVIQQPFFQGAMEKSMATTATSTTILTKAVEPLLKAFTDLMNIGNPYVLMLSEWVVKQSEAAAAFTGSEQGQKKLNDAILLGIDALKQIMDLVGSVGKLFYSVFKTSNESGGGILKTLTELVDAADKWVNSAEGQELLTSLFEASNTILKELGGAVGDVVKFLLHLIKAYNDLDGPAKDVLTTMIVWSAVLTPLATYVTSLAASYKLLFGIGKEAVQAVGWGVRAIQAAPAAMAGFKAGMEGIQVANAGAAGTFGKLGNAVGSIRDGFATAGTKAMEFGSHISSAVSTGASKASEMATHAATAAKGWVDNAAKVASEWAKNLASTVADAGKRAGEMVAHGAKTAAGWVSSAAKASAAWIASFVGMIARGVVAVATMVAQAAVAAAAWVAGAVATAAAWVIANAAMLGIWGLIILAVIGAVALIVANWDTIKTFFIGVFEAIKNAVAGAINWVKENWPLLLAILTGPIGMAVYLIARNWDTIKAAFSAAWQFIQGIWGGVANWFAGIGNGIVNVFNNVKNGIVNGFNNAINWIRGVPGSIMGIFNGIANWLGDSGWNLIMGLWNGISRAIGNVKNWVRDGLNTIRRLFPFSPAKEGPFSGSGYTSHSGYALMNDFGEGIVKAGGEVKTAAQSIIEDVASSFNGLTSEVGSMQTDFGLSANAAMTADIATEMAPPVIDKATGDASLESTGNNVTINQTNEVNTDLDMDLVNRSLAWELNKL